MAKLSTHPWRREFPRDDNIPDIPRMKGPYPRGAARTRQWQEWNNSREESLEDSLYSRRPYNRVSHSEKNKPSQITTDISMLGPRRVSNMVARSEVVKDDPQNRDGDIDARMKTIETLIREMQKKIGSNS